MEKCNGCGFVVPKSTLTDGFCPSCTKERAGLVVESGSLCDTCGNRFEGTGSTCPECLDPNATDAYKCRLCNSLNIYEEDTAFGYRRIVCPRCLEKCLVVTLPNICDQKISSYGTVINAEVILKIDYFEDFFAGVKDLIGGRSGPFAKEFGKARRIAINDLQEKCLLAGYDAVIGVSIDYESISAKRMNVLMIGVTGTPVKLAKPE
jgi:uncharacterized protein YbjQ (UPF0145 family)